MVDPSALLGVLVAERYRVLEIIGRGGASTVFKGEDVRHGRFVAIKVIRSDTSHFGGPERFAREISLLAALQHPHILPLLDSGTVDDHPFYVMPFVQGESLRDRLAREQQIPLQDALRILAEIGDALRYAHESGVVHRDIKPENILLSGRHALLADFGVARVAAQGENPQYTTSGIALGTPAYMSPEQAVADPNIDSRADIYALGCVAFEMLAGRPPFTHPAPARLLAAHVSDAPPTLHSLRPDLPPALSVVIGRCLEKDVAERWSTIAALVEQIEPWVVPSGSITPNTPLVVPRRRIASVVGAMALLAIVGMGAVWWLTSRETIEIANTRRLSASADLELDPAISPDGRLLAYAAGRNGALRIFVRQVDGGGEPIEVGATVGGNQRLPRWGADGSFLVFQSQGGIHRVSPLGGRIETLVPGDPRRPADSPALSPDGASLAYTQGGNLLVRGLADSTGARVLARDPTAHSLAWSPRSRHLAYISANREFALSASLLGNIAPSVLRMVAASGGEPRTLTDGTTLAASPAWLSEQSIAFIADPGGARDVFLVSTKLRNAGPSEWARLTVGLNAHSLSVTADGRQLGVGALVQESNVWAVPADAGATLTIRDAERVTSGAQVVEDVDVHAGTGWLLYDSNQQGNQDLFLLNHPGTRPTQLTFDARNEFGPSWSPNAAEIAYYVVEDGVRHIFVKPLGGMGPGVRVTNDTLQDQQPKWSPDGEHLVFYRRDAAGHDRAFVVGRNGDSTWGAPRALADDYRTGTTWSPDGHWIAYSDSAGQIGVMPAEGGDGRLLASPAQLGAPALKRPQWLPFEAALLVRAESPGGSGGIWQLRLDGGAPREIVRFDDPTRPVYRDDFATDGRRIYFTISNFQGALWLLDLVRRS